MKNVGFLFAGLLLGLILVEILMRLLAPAPIMYPISVLSDNGWHNLSLNKKLIYVPKPNSGELNSRGHRGREFPYEKTAGKRRILFLGDSVLEGLQIPVESRFTEILADKLGAAYEVINLGVTGYNLLQYVEYFKEAGRRYHPDIVFVCIAYNDLELSGGEVFELDEKLEKMGVSEFYAAYYNVQGRLHEWLLRFNAYRYAYLFFSRIDQKNGPDGDDKKSFLDLIYYKMDANDVDRIVDELVSLSAADGFELHFLFTPYDNISEQMDMMRKVTADRGLKFTDLDRRVRDKYGQRGMRILFYDKYHLHYEGHEVVADLIYDVIMPEKR